MVDARDVRSGSSKKLAAGGGHTHTRAFGALLRRLAKVASLTGTVDHTLYGESRSSPQGFYRHYLAEHSHAVVHADALTLLTKADSLSYFFGRRA